MNAFRYRPRWLTRTLLRLLLAWTCPGPVMMVAAGIPAGQLEFFETKVRPILAKNCYSCHSESQGKVKGGLELDWKQGWEKGGDSGPEIIPGKPEESRLIQAIKYTNPDLQMPPKGKQLTPAQVGDLVAWVKMGAPDPRLVKPATLHGTSRGETNHWAFLPLREPPIPRVRDSSRVKTPVDAFLLQKLEENGLTLAPPADPSTLLRRVYFDLIGLPPTPTELTAFLADTSTNAFEKVVDQLLASPHYGERWGRHWLDVARYSDTKGQFKRQRESSLYPYAWTYRDYVIQAFNRDLPWNRFIVEQLAADKLPVGRDNSALAALGFLTVGEHFGGNGNDIINDRIDVVSKGFLGLTVACARCHDHRFDPIPQSDYYAWHGIFNSTVTPATRPVLTGGNTNTAAYRDYLQNYSNLQARLQTVSTSLVATVFGDPKRLVSAYLFATTLPAKDQKAYLEKSGADPKLLKNWQQLFRLGARRELGVFRVWQFAQRMPVARMPEQLRRIFANLGKDERTRQLPPAVLETLHGQAPQSLAELAVLYGILFNKPDPAWQASLNTFLTEAAVGLAPNRERARFFVLREQFDRLELVHDGAPARPMLVADAPAPHDSALFIRGEAGNQGPVVPRRFLEVLSGPNRPVFDQGSGRLQLAQAIASPQNPLTPRVWVNRVWQHHFGEGFVTTPDDFGNQSAPPSHPELLDWLAARFVADGESTKRLHKWIVLSSAYQQSTRPTPEALTRDPDNRLLSHATVRRLEFEPLRDALLSVAGKLDLSIGGKPVDISGGSRRTNARRPALRERMGSQLLLSVANRRTVYGFVDRVELLEVLNTFDFANPALESGKRYETSVPQQALFLMNSPQVLAWAQGIVERDDFRTLGEANARIEMLYRMLFQRLPTPEERRLGRQFLDATVTAMKTRELNSAEAAGIEEQMEKRSSSSGTSASAGVGSGAAAGSGTAPKNAWVEYVQALIMTPEMAFVN